ncbi:MULTISPECIES: DUF2948 family protein [unclassified Rhizobium]|uniref:DUF2948 family protein n=1 Tax=unclassified Rhizobium TaxID=2613769 RepID=UPI001A9943C3|nr:MULTISPECIES: DUF2948 family protein [unclassified Rhizobium]MBX5159421.1 DUF2948 family protein [Rhizobium sp. NZLR8]MBX5170823.1 DUF2948 family protein [Rhizobium sp. NZLR1b]MBX5188505.1 DUF2948 family protein [Rhizobium sp. NZLR3b]MBX5196569.1 DUF2948 family protein [Rhizobium sp. NZLR10]MBX5200961.1 DUF2948 family protein [Rhizobium sp. NZLR1]
MTDLKLVALDDEDLAIISAHMQDSVFKVGDIDWSPRDAQFALAVNRFVWEGAERKRKGFERRRAALVFKRVLAVRSLGIDRGKRDEVLSLLALRFDKKGDGPEGTIELSLSGTASIALDVECIEVQLADIGGAWEASSKPRHR